MDNHPGTYALILHLPSGRTIEVGRLGAVDFKAGFYTYAGSARGPGGLRGRLSRHLRVQNRPHWHIDYLRQAATLKMIWHVQAARRLECLWARCLGQLSGGASPVPGFGSSDCGCVSHLAFFERNPDVQAFQELSRAEIFGQGTAKRIKSSADPEHQGQTPAIWPQIDP